MKVGCMRPCDCGCCLWTPTCFYAFPLTLLIGACLCQGNDEHHPGAYYCVDLKGNFCESPPPPPVRRTRRGGSRRRSRAPPESHSWEQARPPHDYRAAMYIIVGSPRLRDPLPPPSHHPPSTRPSAAAIAKVDSENGTLAWFSENQVYSNKGDGLEASCFLLK